MSNEKPILKWDHDVTLMFLDMVNEHYYEMQTTVKRRVYEKIAVILNEQNDLNITAEQCDTKWKVLVRQYKRINQFPESAKPWEYYSLVGKILDRDKVDSAPVLGASYRDEPFDDTPKIQPTRSKPQVTPKSEPKSPQLPRQVITISAVNSQADRKVSEPPRPAKRRITNDPLEGDKVSMHQEKIERMDRFLDLYEEMIDLKRRSLENKMANGSSDTEIKMLIKEELDKQSEALEDGYRQRHYDIIDRVDKFLSLYKEIGGAKKQSCEFCGS